MGPVCVHTCTPPVLLHLLHGLVQSLEIPSGSSRAKQLRVFWFLRTRHVAAEKLLVRD